MTADLSANVDGPVGYITFERPAQRNAFTRDMLRNLRRMLQELENDSRVRVVVLQGSGGFFSSGADLTELRASSPDSVRASNREWIDLFATIERLQVPVIASVEGPAIAGGTELTLACDLVVASSASKFGLTEMRVGVIPGAGACIRLTRWVGRAAAKELLFTGDPITADRAQQLGLVNRVVDSLELKAATNELALRLASRSSSALAAAKRAVNIGSELDLDRGIEFALGEFSALFGKADQQEGMNAFLDKRGAVFAKRTTGGES